MNFQIRSDRNPTPPPRGPMRAGGLLVGLASLALAMAGGGAWLYAQKSGPAIAWASPTLLEFVQPNQQRSVTVSFRSNQAISDAEVRVVPALASVVSVTPQTFRRINANESVPLTLTLRGPAAAGTKLDGAVQLRSRGGKSTFAEPLQVTVVVHDELVPSDPGEAGKRTVEGVDADNDGVRDDVERFIVEKYAATPNTALALLQLAKSQQQLLVASNDAATLAAAQADNRALECLFYVLPYNEADTSSDEVIGKMLNTRERWVQSNHQNSVQSGHIFSLSPYGERAKQCSFSIR